MLRRRGLRLPLPHGERGGVRGVRSGPRFPRPAEGGPVRRGRAQGARGGFRRRTRASTKSGQRPDTVARRRSGQQASTLTPALSHSMGEGDSSLLHRRGFRLPLPHGERGGVRGVRSGSRRRGVQPASTPAPALSHAWERGILSAPPARPVFSLSRRGGPVRRGRVHGPCGGFRRRAWASTKSGQRPDTVARRRSEQRASTLTPSLSHAWERGNCSGSAGAAFASLSPTGRGSG